MEGHDRLDTDFETCFALTPVTVKSSRRPLAVLRLDSAPLDREAVAVEPNLCAERDVVAPSIPGVAGVARWFDARCSRLVLPFPPVVVPVSALDLMRGGGGPPPEAFGKDA